VFWKRQEAFFNNLLELSADQVHRENKQGATVIFETDDSDHRITCLNTVMQPVSRLFDYS
jgi:hypothetical protein